MFEAPEPNVPQVVQEHKRHDLKCLGVLFDSIASGAKTFEIRKDDRGFRLGDFIILHRVSETSPNEVKFGGKTLWLKITYTLRGEAWGLMKGYVAIGFKILEKTAEARP